MDALNELIRRAMAFFDRVKTRFSGYAVVVLGALLAAGPSLQTVIGPKGLAYITVASGVVIAVIGHYNASKAGK